jgi:hypothetical protein
MDNIVAIRKKIIKKETEEEFHLNPCDIFVTGKKYEINSKSKIFHYLPFHEYLVVLFDDFISIFDIKKSIYENLAILKQFKISEIYNFFFSIKEKTFNNFENFTEEIKAKSTNSTKEANKKDSLAENNYNNINDNCFSESNFNFIAEEQRKELRFFHVSENTCDKKILFFLEFQNKEFLVFEIRDMHTDIFDKPSNLKVKAENISEKNLESNENKADKAFDNVINNLYEEKDFIKSEKKEEKFLNKKIKRNKIAKKLKEDSDIEEEPCISSDEDSEFAVKKNQGKNSLIYKNNKKAKESKNKSSSYKSDLFETEILKVPEINLESEEKLLKENKDSKSILNIQGINLILKLDKSNYFDYENVYFNFLKENFRKKILDKNKKNNSENKLLKIHKIDFATGDLKNEKNENIKEINLLTNSISEFDFNANLVILDLKFLEEINEHESEPMSNKRIFSLIFRSEFNCLFINKIETSEKKINNLNFLKNIKKNKEFQSPFVLFKEYDFKILDYKIFQFPICENKFLIFILVINQDNDILVENYFFHLNKKDLKNNFSACKNNNEMEFQYALLHSKRLIFSDYKAKAKNEENLIFDSAMISDVNLILIKSNCVSLKNLEPEENTFYLFITKMHKVYSYKIKINSSELNKVINEFSLAKSTQNNFQNLENSLILNYKITSSLVFKAFEDLQNQITHTFVLNDFIYCFDTKGNYSFYFLNDLLYNIPLKNNSIREEKSKFIEIKGLKSLSLAREVFAIAPFITEKGFFMLNSYNILKSQDFSINYFIPLNLQVVPNLILNSELNTNIIKAENLITEKINNFKNNNYNLISEYLIRKLRLPASNNDLFEFINKNIDKELLILSNSKIKFSKINKKEPNENLNLLRLRLYYYLNRLKFKENKYDDYKVIKIINSILEKYGKEENLIFENKEINFKTVCEICNDTDLVYNQDELGYICKNDHYFPCCCVTKSPLICLNEKGEIENNNFLKCNFCELFYVAEKITYVKKYKTCLVCVNTLNKF